MSDLSDLPGTLAPVDRVRAFRAHSVICAQSAPELLECFLDASAAELAVIAACYQHTAQLSQSFTALARARARASFVCGMGFFSSVEDELLAAAALGLEVPLELPDLRLAARATSLALAAELVELRDPDAARVLAAPLTEARALLADLTPQEAAVLAALIETTPGEHPSVLAPTARLLLAELADLPT